MGTTKHTDPAVSSTSQAREWDAVYREGATPWDQGKPEPTIVQLVNSGQLRPGKLLDLGCGPGNDAAFLALHGFAVVGCDISAVAVSRARSRADPRRGDCEFITGDAFALPLRAGVFDIVLDKACFHFTPPHRRLPYLESVHRVLTEKGLLLLFVASDRDVEISGPYKFTSNELVALVSTRFRILLMKTVTLAHHQLMPCPYFCILERK